MVPPIPNSVSRTHERVQGLHAFHQVPANSNGMRSPVFPSGRRSGAPRGMAPIGPVASSSDSGFVVFPTAGTSGRNHQDAENPGRNRFYAWERDRFAPFPLIPVDRESSWWGPFHQGTSGSDSTNRSSSYWHRHGSERTSSQNRSESSSYRQINSSSQQAHPFFWNKLPRYIKYVKLLWCSPSLYISTDFCCVALKTEKRSFVVAQSLCD